MNVVDINIPYLFLESRLTIDQNNLIFLLVSIFLWLVCLTFAYFTHRNDESKFRMFFSLLLAMIGHLGLIISGDLISFYTFFTLMNFSAYIMITYNQTKEAFHAGFVYLSLVIIGEAFILPALWLTFIETQSLSFSVIPTLLAESELSPIIISLFLVGFGIKAGALPLHIWLPMAHPVAPSPASAILSGVIIKASIIGWLNILPLGEMEYSFIGKVVMIVGMIGAFYAAIIGFFQEKIKASLAYSSVSQMGIVISLLGLCLLDESLSEFLVVLILLFVTHHALTKTSLFLGVDVLKKHNHQLRPLILFLFTISALSLSGFMFTSGYSAKFALKEFFAEGEYSWFLYFLYVSSISTSLLILKIIKDAFTLAKNSEVTKSSYFVNNYLWLAFVCLIFTFWYLLILPQPYLINTFKLSLLWGASWPILSGAVFFLAFLKLPNFYIKPGDIFYLIRPMFFIFQSLCLLICHLIERVFLWLCSLFNLSSLFEDEGRPFGPRVMTLTRGVFMMLLLIVLIFLLGL